MSPPCCHSRESRRLVEKHHAGLLRQRLRRHHLLSLTVAQCASHASGKMLYAHHTQALAHYAPVVVAEASEESRVRTAPHGSHLKHGEVLHLRPLREHHSDEPRQFLTGERVNLSLAELLSLRRA